MPEVEFSSREAHVLLGILSELSPSEAAETVMGTLLGRMIDLLPREDLMGFTRPDLLWELERRCKDPAYSLIRFNKRLRKGPLVSLLVEHRLEQPTKVTLRRRFKKNRQDFPDFYERLMGESLV